MIARAAVVLLALLCAGCPEEEDPSFPVLSDTGAGSLPTNAQPDRSSAGGAGTYAGTGDTGDSGGPSATAGGPGSSGSDEGSDVSGGHGTASDSGSPTTLGEPPMVTTGIITTG